MNTVSTAVSSVSAPNVVCMSDNPACEVGLGTREVNGFNLLVLRVNGETHRVILNHVQWQDMRASGIPVLAE